MDWLKDLLETANGDDVFAIIFGIGLFLLAFAGSGLISDLFTGVF